MSRKTYLLGIFILWIPTMVQCNSTTLPTRITCPDTYKLCGDKFCYDPATQFCSETGSVVTCINACGQKCYDSATQVCIDGTVCTIGSNLCEVKYNNRTGNLIEPSGLECYNPWSHRCLNHTICYEKDRVCNGQCILGTSSYQSQVCANDNVTLCDVEQHYNNYKPNRIQLCNGSCYDTENGLKHCVNGSVQCVSNCSDVCYNANTAVCAKGKICYLWQDACLTNYNSYDGSPLFSSTLECYYNWSSKCIDGALCSNNRICNEQCITGYNASYTICANDRRTTCNVTSYFSNYRPYQMHLCNGKCFDTSLEQCINGNVSCIDNICNGECYNSASHVCLNNTLCSVGEDVCEVKYDRYSGAPIEPPQLRCYDPRFGRCLNYTICSVGEDVCEVKYDSYSGAYIEPSQLRCYDPRFGRCLNHTICYEKDRVCNGQCILGSSYYQYQYQVCADDNKTLCKVGQHYANYKPNQIQVCNGSCFDVGQPPLYQCLNSTVQCILNCSGKCYNRDRSVCLNGSICSIGFELCESGSVRQCYDPSYTKCLNGTLCSNSRACGGQCINNDYQVCANDKRTICNVTEPYYSYEPNQIQLCLGVCFDSAIEQCSGEHIVLCIHDPETQQCVPQNVNSSTTTPPSPSTINSISFDVDTNTSNISTNTSPVSSSISASNAEATSSSIILATTTGTASPSLPSSVSSLLTTPTDFSTEPFSYETKTITTTVLPASRSTFTPFLSLSSSSEDTNNPSIFLSSSSTSATTGRGPGASIISTDTSSSRLSHSSNSFSFTTEPHYQTTLLWTSTPFLGSGSSSEGTNIQLISTDTTSSSTFPSLSPVLNSLSSSSSMLATTGTDPGASIISTDTSSSRLSHSSNSFIFTREPPSQTTVSFIPTFPSQDSCCAAKECTNDTDCCVPRVECRCHPHSKTSDDSQACRAIVIGKNNNNSFVIAIALNDEKVIVINHNHFFLLLLSIAITCLLLLLIRVSFLTVIHRKTIATNFRVWYLSGKTHITESERKQWEGVGGVQSYSCSLKLEPDRSRWNSEK